ncbi:MAG: GHKL domain-containing protein [Butyrivibrio sp.]|nr:GHKL domain-containing protein [Butyrivibrio sp.]
MNLSAFLDPVQILDTPRLFTAIAEWLAVFVYFFIYKRKYGGKVFCLQCAASLILMVAYQFVAGLLPIFAWIPAMLGAVLLMYGMLFLVLDIKPRDCGVLTIHAFVFAEFAASLYRQLYVWIALSTGKGSLMVSFVLMFIVYACVYPIFYRLERGNISPDHSLGISWREFWSVLIMGTAVFAISNISFVSPRTPFSATENLLYVRTLVDFGGIMMLMTQMGRRNEMILRNEANEINQLFQKQYEQYRLAMDNSDAMRKEIHDMKHYLLALKNEDDPGRRADVLKDMEQAIAIQESFMNTGNKVLDVILTTKSLQCQKQNITLNAMVDGELLNGIHVKDICSLFGNLLDNAIEATSQIDEKEKRFITLNMKRKNDFIMVECENCSDPSNVSLLPDRKKGIFEKGNLPRTTKADNVRHGYGLKSINMVAEKYGGAMKCTYEDGWFKVRVLLSCHD